MLKVLLVTQDDPFYIPIFFKELLKKDIKNYFILAGIIVQPPLGKKSFKKLVQQMLDFYGYKIFFRVGIKYVFFKVLGLVAVKICHGKFPGVFSTRHIILKNGFRTLELKNINSKETLDLLKKMDIDLIFSIAASQIFKKDVLELPKLGCYNIHTSKLPKNRGMMPNFWSLYNFDEDPISAVTIHKMNEKLDDGEILVQREFSLNPNESLDTLIRKTKKISVDVFLQSINMIAKGELHFIENDATHATYHSFPRREDVLKFESKRLRLL